MNLTRPSLPIKELPDVIPCNEWMSYDKKGSWKCERGYVRLPEAVRDSIYRDAERRLREIETNIKP
jgi:hypothetical protein